MSRISLAIFSAALQSLAALPAAMAQTRSWVTAGDWNILSDTGPGEGCAAVTADAEDRASFTLGFDRAAQRYFIVAASRQWIIEAGRRYEVALGFDKTSTLFLNAMAETGNGIGRLLWEGEDLTPLVAAVAQERRLHLELTGVRMASFSLDGVRPAIDALLRCRQRTLAAVALPAPAAAASIPTPSPASGTAPVPTRPPWTRKPDPFAD